MMKRTVLLLLAAFCGVLTAAAQDLIVKHDATKVEAKVSEITTDEVRYKRYSNPDGPTYVVPVSEIDYIQYANGEKELFGKPERVPAAKLTPAVKAETSATPVPGQYVLKTYEIGDLYDQDGVRGVICVLSEDKLHGLVISLDQIYLPWSEFRKSDLRAVGADDRADGGVNMEKVAAYIAANDLSWEDFPAFKWCRDQGEGWYLPAIDELLNIGHSYNGGARLQSNRKFRNGFNATLKENNGKRMDRMVYYFSSTEDNEKEAFTSHMALEPPYVVEIPKSNKFLVRAVHKF